MAKSTSAHAEQRCGCVPFGEYFLSECEKHAALRVVAEKRREAAEEKRKKPGKPTKKSE